MLLRRRITLPLTLALVASATVARAQPSVPGELVRALLTANELAVGRAPAGFPAELVPAGGRVLGGFQSGRGAVLAAAMPQAPGAADEAARQTLVGAGWTYPASREERGFVGPRNESSWRLLCRGGETVTLSSLAAPGGGSYLRMEYHRTDQPSACSFQPHGMSADPWPAIPVPTLTMPAGAAIVTTSMGNRGAVGGEVGARIRSGMGANELAAAFERQLRQAGWTLAPPTGDARATVQTFRMRGADGKEWFGVLTAVAIPGSQMRDVAFAVSALPPPAQ